MKSLSQMIRQYRQGRTQLQRYDAKIARLQQKIHEIRNHQTELQQEVQNTRTVIDFCIETGQSPVAAKLSHTLGQMESSLYSTLTNLSSNNIGSYVTIGNGNLTGSLSTYSSIGNASNSRNYGLSISSPTIGNSGHISVGGAVGSTYTTSATNVKGGSV